MKDGGKAFPQTLVAGHSEDICLSDGFKNAAGQNAGGLTMRQYYKAAALTGVLYTLANNESYQEAIMAAANRGTDIDEVIAAKSAALADAMIAEDEAQS